jgi:hypothetical protein
VGVALTDILEAAADADSRSSAGGCGCCGLMSDSSSWALMREDRTRRFASGSLDLGDALV